MQPSDSLSADLTQGMRQAMRRLASSVVIATARDGDKRYAISVSAVTSLSLEPPSLLICVNRLTSIYPALVKKNDFCINVLSASHRDLSIACGGAERGEARFTIGDWRDDPDGGTPFLADAQASLICAVDDIHRYGTHGIVIGRVKRIRLNGDVDPLVYVDGRYTSVIDCVPI